MMNDDDNLSTTIEPDYFMTNNDVNVSRLTFRKITTFLR